MAGASIASGQADGAPSIGVFTMRSLHLAQGKAISFIGASAVAFLVEKEVILEGVVDVRGRCPSNAGGPGGFAGAATVTDTIPATLSTSPSSRRGKRCVTYGYGTFAGQTTGLRSQERRR